MKERSHAAASCAESQVQCGFSLLVGFDFIAHNSQQSAVGVVVVELALVTEYDGCQLDQQGFVTSGNLKLSTSFNQECWNCGLKRPVPSYLLCVFAADPWRRSSKQKDLCLWSETRWSCQCWTKPTLSICSSVKWWTDPVLLVHFLPLLSGCFLLLSVCTHEGS